MSLYSSGFLLNSRSRHVQCTPGCGTVSCLRQDWT